MPPVGALETALKNRTLNRSVMQMEVREVSGPLSDATLRDQPGSLWPLPRCPSGISHLLCAVDGTRACLACGLLNGCISVYL